MFFIFACKSHVDFRRFSDHVNLATGSDAFVLMKLPRLFGPIKWLTGSSKDLYLRIFLLVITEFQRFE